MGEILRALWRAFASIVSLMAVVLWMAAWFRDDFQQTVVWGIAAIACKTALLERKESPHA